MNRLAIDEFVVLYLLIALHFRSAALGLWVFGLTFGLLLASIPTRFKIAADRIHFSSRPTNGRRNGRGMKFNGLPFREDFSLFSTAPWCLSMFYIRYTFRNAWPRCDRGPWFVELTWGLSPRDDERLKTTKQKQTARRRCLFCSRC